MLDPGDCAVAQAMETADVVLMQDDLSHIGLALRVARKSRRVIKQNIVLSLGLKLAFLGLALPGTSTIPAVAADRIRAATRPASCGVSPISGTSNSACPPWRRIRRTVGAYERPSPTMTG